MNETFYDTAFSEAEKASILTTNVDNSARSANANSSATTFNGGVNAFACENTQDKVFLLSVKEATNNAYGFSTSVDLSDTVRRKQSTDYAKSQGTYAKPNSTPIGNALIRLRSPYYATSVKALRFGSGGFINTDNVVRDTYYGIVPAVRISRS